MLFAEIGSAFSSPSPRRIRSAPLCSAASASAVEAWLDATYDKIDYEQVLFGGSASEEETTDATPPTVSRAHCSSRHQPHRLYVRQSTGRPLGPSVCSLHLVAW